MGLYHKNINIVNDCRRYINLVGRPVHIEELFLNTRAQTWYTFRAFRRALSMQPYWQDEECEKIVELPGEYWVTQLMYTFKLW